MIKRKKGELTSKHLVTIIIIIFSFAVILIFYFTLNLKGQINEQTCRQSLAQREVFSKIGFKGINAGKLISVKCETKEVCISMGGDCSGAGKDVEKVSVKTLSEVDRKISDLANDCWSMVGLGKISIGPVGTCGLCSIVYFDDKVQSLISKRFDRFGDSVRGAVRGNTYDIYVKNKDYASPLAMIAYRYGKDDFEIWFAPYSEQGLKIGCKDWLF